MINCFNANLRTTNVYAEGVAWVLPTIHTDLGIFSSDRGGSQVNALLPYTTMPVPAFPTYRWAYVRQRFEGLLENLKITTDQVEDGETKHKGVVAALNRIYWGHAGDTVNCVLIGSWGKTTRVRPPRDIDLMFMPGVEVYHAFNQRAGNKQSQLLQDIANVLRGPYPQTTIRADGQVVVVGFNTYKIEVVPTFRAEGGGFLICDTNDDGR